MIIVTNKDDRFKKPEDIRRQISKWISYACDTGELPFIKDGGIIVQLLNVWIKSYEITKLDEIESRLEALENGERTFIVPTAPEESQKQANGKQQKKEEAMT